MSQENYMLSVYSAISGQAEDIEVNEAVYNEYRRGGWRVDNNDRSFREHETPFSDLKGGLDGAYENFDEFRAEHNDPAQLVVSALTQQDLRRAFACLAEDERELLQALIIEGKSERQTAAAMGVPRMTISDRKTRLLRKMRRILEN